jgi:arylsulfatase A-like enzyme
MQQRTLGALLRSLRGLPTWDDTVIVYLSDHGEGFREHGQLYHLHSLHEEEVRVPGWIAAGAHALTDSARNGLSTYRDRRTDTQDVHATVLDLLGAFDAQARFPFGDRMTGRSLLRPRREPMLALMASETAVWEPDDAQYGAMSEDRLLVGSAASPWRCYDLSADAEERHPLPADACGMLQTSAEIAFGNRVRRAATAGSTP